MADNKKASKALVTDLPVSLVISSKGGKPYISGHILEGELRDLWYAYRDIFLTSGHPQQNDGASKTEAIDEHHKIIHGQIKNFFGHDVSLVAYVDANGQRSTQSENGWKTDGHKWVGHFAVTTQGTTTPILAYFGMENPQVVNDPENEVYNSIAL